MSDSVTLTAVFTPDENGWTMAQLAEWPAVVTCGPTEDEARTMLVDAAREMITSYRDEGREPPIGGGHVDVASANVALYERARPVFADIDPVTLNLDPAAAEAAVTERTRALLPVHIFGYPADMPSFERIAARHGLGIVEDACEALGAIHAV